MKKTNIAILTTLLALSITSCDLKNYVSDNINFDTTTENAIQIPTPFVECDNLADAWDIAGFEFSVPNSIGEYSQSAILAYENYMIDIILTNKNNTEDTVRIRKALDSADISGDYTVYDEEKTFTINNFSLSIKGSDDKVYLVTGTNGNYSYSISISNGISFKDLVNLINIDIN